MASGQVGRRQCIGQPLFSLDQNEFETAIAADHVNVEETARKRLALRRRGVRRRDLRVHARARRRHRPDGVLRQLPAPPADAARHPGRHRREPVAGGAQPSRAASTRRRVVIGLSAGRPHPLVVRAMKIARHRKARAIAVTDATLSDVAKLSQHPALLLLQLPRLRPVAHRTAQRHPGTRVRRVQPRPRQVRRPDQGVPAEVAVRSKDQSGARPRRRRAASRSVTGNGPCQDTTARSAVVITIHVPPGRRGSGAALAGRRSPARRLVAPPPQPSRHRASLVQCTACVTKRRSESRPALPRC